MKRHLLIILFLKYAIAVVAQVKLPIKDMQVPSTPAFILLDASPTSVERPLTTKAFALNIVDAISQNSGFPKNFGSEINPYWLFKHKRLSPDTHFGISGRGPLASRKKDSKGGFIYGDLPVSQLKYWSLSLGLISQTDSTSQKNRNSLSIGVRGTPVRLMSKQQLVKLAISLDRIEQLTIDANKEIAANPNATDQEIQSILDKLDKLSSAEAEALKDIRPFLAIEMATAYSTSFLDSDYGNRTRNRFGAWLTATGTIPLGKSSEVDRAYLNVLGVGRFLHDSFVTEEIEDKQYLDAGIKLEFEKNRIWIGYEYVKRYDIGSSKGNLYRSAGMLKYKIKEDMFLLGTFGRNFGRKDNLLTLFGISWGFGNGKESLEQ